MAIYSWETFNGSSFDDKDKAYFAGKAINFDELMRYLDEGGAIGSFSIRVTNEDTNEVVELDIKDTPFEDDEAYEWAKAKLSTLDESYVRQHVYTESFNTLNEAFDIATIKKAIKIISILNKFAPECENLLKSIDGETNASKKSKSLNSLKTKLSKLKDASSSLQDIIELLDTTKSLVNESLDQWLCRLDKKDLGIVEAEDEEDAYAKARANWPDEALKDPNKTIEVSRVVTEGYDDPHTPSQLQYILKDPNRQHIQVDNIKEFFTNLFLTKSLKQLQHNNDLYMLPGNKIVELYYNDKTDEFGVHELNSHASFKASTAEECINKLVNIREYTSAVYHKASEDFCAEKRNAIKSVWAQFRAQSYDYGFDSEYLTATGKEVPDSDAKMESDIRQAAKEYDVSLSEGRASVPCDAALYYIYHDYKENGYQSFEQENSTLKRVSTQLLTATEKELKIAASQAAKIKDIKDCKGYIMYKYQQAAAKDGGKWDTSVITGFYKILHAGAVPCSGRILGTLCFIMNWYYHYKKDATDYANVVDTGFHRFNKYAPTSSSGDYLGKVGDDLEVTGKVLEVNPNTKLTYLEDSETGNIVQFYSSDYSVSVDDVITVTGVVSVTYQNMTTKKKHTVLKDVKIS